MSDPRRGVIVADFTAKALANYLSHDEGSPAVDVEVAPYGPVLATLSTISGEYDFGVVWSRPEAVSPGFRRLLDAEEVSTAEILRDVDAFCERVLFLNRFSTLFLPTWTLPPEAKGCDLESLKAGSGAGDALLRMNLRLIDTLQGHQGTYVLDANRWMEGAIKQAHHPKLWYLGKVAYANEVFKEAAKSIRNALSAIAGKSRKVILLDLDNTLWGGVVGEVGWENLKVGGHDPHGEAFVDFQRALKALKRKGILLGLLSKNNESVALEAFRKHREMVLTLEDFVGWRINWQDKAENLLSLVNDLNVGLDSVVFIDDHPAERARVREAFPEVLVPEWPVDSLFYPQALHSLGCFDFPTISTEDRRRTELYLEEKKRHAELSGASSLQEWRNTLDLRVTWETLDKGNLPRVSQLLNKTNQMNLSTRRLTAGELRIWAKHEERAVWALRVSDRFGDSGISGILSVEIFGNRVRIVDFVLSCRVFGREIEKMMLAKAVTHARAKGFASVEARYRPTPKNQPCLEFLKASGFSFDPEEIHFLWNASDPYAVPTHLTSEDAGCERISSIKASTEFSSSMR